MASRRRRRYKGGIRVVKKTVEKIVEKIVRRRMKEFPHDEGELVVGPGIHEIAISTRNRLQTLEAQGKGGKGKPDNQPERVWVSLEEGGAIPVCGGGVDTASTEITSDGFVLHLNIQSTERTVKWYVEL